jgi:hypothetical protein
MIFYKFIEKDIYVFTFVMGFQEEQNSLSAATFKPYCIHFWTPKYHLGTLFQQDTLFSFLILFRIQCIDYRMSTILILHWFPLSIWNIKPSLRDSKPSFRDVKPSIRNSKPSIRNPKPSIRNPKPSIRNHNIKAGYITDISKCKCN